jgi:hypothetical protein
MRTAAEKLADLRASGRSDEQIRNFAIATEDTELFALWAE